MKAAAPTSTRVVVFGIVGFIVLLGIIGALAGDPAQPPELAYDRVLCDQLLSEDDTTVGNAVAAAAGSAVDDELRALARDIQAVAADPSLPGDQLAAAARANRARIAAVCERIDKGAR